MRRLTCNNSMAYLKNWTDNFFQIFFMGTSWVAVSINNIKTRASSEMTSRKNIKIFDFNGVNLPSTGMWRGEVFAISDCLVALVVHLEHICSQDRRALARTLMLSSMFLSQRGLDGRIQSRSYPRSLRSVPFFLNIESLV